MFNRTTLASDHFPQDKRPTLRSFFQGATAQRALRQQLPVLQVSLSVMPIFHFSPLSGTQVLLLVAALNLVVHRMQRDWRLFGFIRQLSVRVRVKIKVGLRFVLVLGFGDPRLFRFAYMFMLCSHLFLMTTPSVLSLCATLLTMFEFLKRVPAPSLHLVPFSLRVFSQVRDFESAYPYDIQLAFAGKYSAVTSATSSLTCSTCFSGSFFLSICH